MPINISNPKGRDAVVAFETLSPRRSVRYTDPKGRPVATRKLLKSDITHDLPQLMKRTKKLDKIADALVKSDPEIDVEDFGMFLTDTSRVYVTKKGIAHIIEEFEVVHNADGSVREKRPRRREPQNVNVTDAPVKWTGKFIKKAEAVKRFVFANKKQLVHVNGLTYDFLFDMAKTLHKKDSLLLVRAGEGGDKPIVLNRGGKPYNAFLEGRVEGDSYCLILHLSNIELKKPKGASEE